MEPPLKMQMLKEYLTTLKDASKDKEIREALETLNDQVFSGRSKRGLDVIMIEYEPVIPIRGVNAYCSHSAKLSLEFTVGDLRALLDNLEAAEPTVEMRDAVAEVRADLSKTW